MNWLTGEPDFEVLDSRAVVGPEKSEEKRDWPNLADVPDKKPVFSPAAVRMDESQELTSDRLQAQAESARVLGLDLPEPAGETEDVPLTKPFSALIP